MTKHVVPSNQGRSPESKRIYAKIGFILGIIGTSMGLLWVVFYICFFVLPGLSPEDFNRQAKPSSLILQGQGQLELKIVNETLSETQLSDLIALARNKNNIPEGHSPELISRINQALQNQIPPDTEIAYSLKIDSPDRNQITSSIPYLLNKKTVLSGDTLRSASVIISNNEPQVSISFNKAGSISLNDMTKQNIGKRLAILVDGQVYSAPVIKEAIPNGYALITLGGTNYISQLEAAIDLVQILHERYKLKPQ